MTTERILIEIREDGSRVVRRNIQEIGESSRKSADSVDFLKKALAALAAFVAVDKVRQYADAWASASGAIRIATKSTEEATVVQEKLFKAAQTTRTEFSAVVELYTRVARSGKELGKSQNDIIKFTEGIGKALAVQGGSAESSKGALLQLGQALGSGTVRAEEFNSVLEGAPYILQVVANNLKGAEGSIAKLRKIMLDGKLTSKDFFEAFQKGAPQIEKDFAKSALTIAQSMTVVTNALTKYIGETDTALGVSAAIGKVAKYVADNMDTLAAAFIGVGVAAAVAFAPGAVSTFAVSLTGLFALVAANPFLALAVVLAGLFAYFFKLRDSIEAGIDGITTLGDVFRAFGEIAVAAFNGLVDTVHTVFTDVIDFAGKAYDYINEITGGAVESWLSSFGGFYDGVGKGFAGVVRGIARTFDAIGGLLIGLVNAITTVVNGVPGVFEFAFRKAYNAAVGYIEDLVNATINGINTIRGYFGKDLLETVKLERLQVNEQFFQQYGAAIADSIDNGFKAQGGALEASVNQVFDRAVEISKNRARDAFRAMEKANIPNLDAPLGKGAAPIVDEKALAKAVKAFELLKNQLRETLDRVAPLEGAFLEMAKAIEIVNKASLTQDPISKKLLINDEQRTRYLQLIARYYRDQLDPLAAVNRELDNETKLLTLNSQEREIAVRLRQTELDLLSKGVILTEAERKTLESRLVTLQMTTRVVAEQDAILAETVGKREQFANQLIALQNLMAQGMSAADQAVATAGLAQNAGLDIEGTQVAADAKLAVFQNMYASIDKLRERNLINDETAEVLRKKVAIQAQSDQLKNTEQFFSGLASLSKSGNKNLAAIGKAAAIAQATIQGYVAVQNALATQPYYVGIALAVGAAAQAAMNIAAIQKTGYEEGGFTGSGGKKQIAGVVHGREFVVNADATAKNRSLLEAINNGVTLNKSSSFGTDRGYEMGGFVSSGPVQAPAANAPVYGSSPGVKVVVNNYSDSKVSTEERQGPEGPELVLTIERVVSRSIGRGGAVAGAIESQYGLNRAQGASL